MILNRLKLAADDPVLGASRLDLAFDLVEARTGEAGYFAGETSPPPTS